MMVAAYRARATIHHPDLCNDPWAAQLAGDEGYRLADMLDVAQPQMELWIAVRTGFIDRHVRHLISAQCGATQVVILGAGLDTRAARLATPGVRFFEVDHPATGEHKRACVGELAGYPVGDITFVRCDFERDDFLEQLVASGFDRDRPAAIVWEGVACYLTEEAVRATLGRIATGCHPRTSVVFDTIGKKMVAGSSRHEEDRDASRLVDAVGEPVRWGVDDPLPLLYEVGFRRVAVSSFDAAALDLTGTYDRERRWRFQAMSTASVARCERGE